MQPMYVGCGDLKIRDVMDSSILVKLPLRDGRRIISFYVYVYQMSLQSTQKFDGFQKLPLATQVRCCKDPGNFRQACKKYFQIGLSR